MENIAFIDLEASGLRPNSWPIEVGWCFEDGSAESYLIQPASDWPRDAWDARAEALHRIPYETLLAAGTPIADVCRRLNEALDGATIYSDAPDWDGFWLWRLFKAGGARQRFKLSDFGAFFKQMDQAEKQAIIAAATKIRAHSHRAIDDVLHMREVYRLRTSRG